MAPPAGTLRVGRYFLVLLATFVVLFAVVFWPGTDHAPRLGLDLRGGAQIIYKAETANGKTPSTGSMTQAKSIIEQRVNGLGVEQAQVVIQGSDEIVVTVPGKRADQLSSVGNTALLNFRPLLAGGFAASAATATSTGTATGSAGTTPAATSTASASTRTTGGASPATSGSTKASSSAVSGQNAADQPIAAASTAATAKAATTTATHAATGTPVASTPAASPSAAASPTPSASASPGSTLATTAIGFSALTDAQKIEIEKFNCADTPKPDAQKNIVVCDQAHTTRYLLGPVLVPGTEVSSATAVAPSGTGSFSWTVSISLKSGGQTIWSEYTAKHHSDSSTTATDPADYVLFTLDDAAITAPTQINGTINGDTQVEGNFSQTQADDLANSLKYGALPLKFVPQATSTVSATLGTAQLKDGLLAGGIGLILVVIYSLFYYRALGLVTIASLLVSGGLTYASLVILGAQIGFTLTLAGIAGFIVAVGITADSFVVLFERIKDEVHEGRTMRVAVPRAWIRARRTIISADIVSFLAAAVLYEFAAGDVRGFAFTLGMSTILDLVVVFLFTHPLVSLLSRSASFGSARFSGLDAVRVGGVAQAALTAEQRRRVTAARRAASRNAYPGDMLTDSDDDFDDEVIDGEVDDLELADAADESAETDGAAAPVPADSLAPSDNELAPGRRVRTEPATGSAAERAAARRARIREEGGSSARRSRSDTMTDSGSDSDRDL